MRFGYLLNLLFFFVIGCNFPLSMVKFFEKTRKKWLIL